MTKQCTKRAYASQRMARRAIPGIEQMNGHPMFSYRCRRCGSWHLTARNDDEGRTEKVLPWRRVNHGRFEAQFGDGLFVVWRDGDEWRVECPNGLRVGTFPRLGTAKQWCDGLSFLPEERWVEVPV